ncbi:hypothetical protein SLEP1_g42248 [Rubroshorea leprosula]|uniref:F-box associated domain-containing protein n=1 Tax=Rubroshorea leprosula TaxID=152421 RepID=A0AAV5LAK7_9ROSI|nr:hypothetical protein SLEP1_g42248 [Rubroshorea leprosula]
MLSLELNYQGLGFGYDSAIDDHRVVFITGSRKIHSMRLKTGLLNTGVQSVDYQFTISTYNRKAMVVDNCLYWMVRKEVPGMLVCVGTSGRLSLFGKPFDNIHSDVWVMEENQVTKTKSWIKLFRIPKIGQLGDVDLVYLPVYPMAFTGSGQVLISECGKFGLGLFDLKDGSFKEIAIHSPYRYCLAPNFFHFGLTQYVQNLASLGA